jgi:hypothetical protein
VSPRGRATPRFDSSVFINCPFDAEYLPLLRPLLFTTTFLGLTPRIASERSDSTENRLDKIVALIRESRLSIHDISRFRAKTAGEVARFNLPFELGLALGSRVFGPSSMQRKCCLILEREPHEFRRALSDLAGVDIKHHNDKGPELVRAVRSWFVETVKLRRVQSPTVIWYRFTDFASDLYDRRKADGFSDDDIESMPVSEYLDSARRWVRHR